MLPILVILACIAIPICLYNYFEDKNKAIGNSLANKTQKITLDAIRAQRDYDRYFYEANIEKWKQSKFYCFVLKTIHDVAKDGESGVIINYLTEKMLSFQQKQFIVIIGKLLHLLDTRLFFEKLIINFHLMNLLISLIPMLL